MAARHRAMKKYASGGTIKGVEVPGKQVIQEAEADSDGFKKGGMVAAGLKAGGSFAKTPRKASGGPAKPVKLARGGSPFSAASKGGTDASDKGSECS